MAIPAIPAQGQPWLTYAQGLDDEIRTGRLSDPALRAALVESNPNFLTGLRSQAADGTQIGVMAGTNQKSLINWHVDAGTGSEYAVHITAGPTFDGSGLIGLGNDFGNKPALLINNKAAGAGISLQNMNTVTGGAVGFRGLNSGATQTLVELQQEAGAARGKLLDLIGSSSDPNAVVWRQTDEFSNVYIESRAGGLLRLRGSSGGETQFAHTDSAKWRSYSYTGSAGLFWPFAIVNDGPTARVKFQAGGAAAIGSETLNTMIEFDVFNNGIGFFGATPVAKRVTTANATDLASVITLANALKADLVALGFKA